MNNTLSYLPGSKVNHFLLLERFLPPLSSGLNTGFLERYKLSSEWILDPFGTCPSQAVEIAQAGKKVLVAINNPIMRFLLDLAAHPPTKADLQGALAELSATRKGEERLETYIQSLYLTDCHKCKRKIPAEAFIWEKGSQAPAARIYHCPCGESGEFPITETDTALPLQIAASESLHRSRALEFIASPGDPDRVFAEYALDCYIPRAVFAIITIINKLAGLQLPVERRRAIQAMALFAFDEANTLWPFPIERPRPKQLAIPPRFIEKNIWFAMERFIDLWDSAPTVQTTEWVDRKNDSLLNTGGIYIFEGPLRTLAPGLSAISPGAVITTLPRPNQAFWTLSTLWAGWLWGRDSVAPFKPVLRRRRYDWDWYAKALLSALKHLSPYLSLNAPFFAFLTETEPSYLSATLIAAARAGFDLEGMAMRDRQDPLQVLWHRRAFLREEKVSPGMNLQVISDALESFLRERGEPATYLHLHGTALSVLAREQSLQYQMDSLPTIQSSIRTALSGPGFIHHSESSNPENGLWGLNDWDSEPLPDRAEIAVVRLLTKNPALHLHEVEVHLYNTFTGLQTPSLALVTAILNSYGIEKEASWSLRLEDMPSARLGDLASTSESLVSLATRLGYTAHAEVNPWRIIRWTSNGKLVYSFHLIASAVVGKILRGALDPPERCILVMPGGRSGLLSYKLDRIPDLKEHAERWRMLKFRHLRNLYSLPGLNQDLWEKELSNDPMEPPEQMKLF